MALVALAYPAWANQRYAFVWLAANFAATLLACLGMDLGIQSDIDATVTMMIVDFATGVAMMSKAGLSRVISATYALTVPLYGLAIHDLLTRIEPDFTLMYIVNGMQIMALAFGALGDNSGGGPRRRFVSGRVPLALSKGNRRLLPGTISRLAGEDR